MTTPYGGPPQYDPQFGGAHGYPPPPAQGYPAAPQQPYYQQPPRPKSRTGLWIGLGVGVLVFAVAVAGGVIWLTRETDITDLTSSMVLPESEFPDVPDGEFVKDPVENDPEWDPADVKPAKCFAVVQYPRATQAVRSSVTDPDGSGYMVTLRIDEKRTDLPAVLAECESEEIEYADLTATVSSLDVPDLPDWAVAVVVDTGDGLGFSYVSGYYRGVLVDVEHFGEAGDADVDELGRLFNAQVERLADR